VSRRALVRCALAFAIGLAALIVWSNWGEPVVLFTEAR
jgi:hypothetical protein